MKTYETNKPAPYGVYFSMKPIDVRFVGAEGETLEGPARSYKRLSMIAVALLGPVLGGVFVFAFPALVLLGVLYTVIKGAVAKVRTSADEAAQVASLRWAPGASYLNKIHDPNAGDAGAPRADELDGLRAEVDARRSTESQEQK